MDQRRRRRKRHKERVEWRKLDRIPKISVSEDGKEKFSTVKLL